MSLWADLIYRDAFSVADTQMPCNHAMLRK